MLLLQRSVDLIVVGRLPLNLLLLALPLEILLFLLIGCLCNHQ